MEQGMDADAFAGRIFTSLMGGMEIASVYLGDRLGLYGALAEADGSMTSSELGERAGVAERYAREWLEQQAAIGFLTVEDVTAGPTERRFALPAGHAAVLIDKESPSYLGGAPRMFAASMRVMPELLEAYRTGGGVGWARFGDDMIEGQADTNRPLFLSTLGREWLGRVDGVHDALTAGGRVADVGCGFGWSSIAIALAYPEAAVTGFDPDEASIDAARRNAAEMGVDDRVTFVEGDAAEADPGDGFDLAIACECIHDMPNPVPVLSAMRRLVADRGTVVVIDEAADENFSAPGTDLDQALYGYSLLVCLPDGMAHEGSVGTGTVIRPATMRRYAEEAGFSETEVLPIEHDQFRVYRLVG